MKACGVQYISTKLNTILNKITSIVDVVLQRQGSWDVRNFEGRALFQILARRHV